MPSAPGTAPGLFAAAPAAVTADGYQLGRRPGLDGLRGIAVLMVLVGHTALPSTGGLGRVGVAVFFVLSGFLITRLLLEEWDRSQRIALPRFYVRRALRLLPAMVLYLLLTAVVAVRYGEPLIQLVWAGLYLTNIVRASGELVTLTQHTWSLAMEEQFYIVWPVLLVLLLSRARTGRRGVAMAVGALILLSLVYRWALALADVELYRIYNDPFAVSVSLLAGGLVSVTISSRRWQRLGGLAFGASLAGLVWAGTLEKGMAIYAVGVPAITLAAAVLVVVLVRDGPGPRWIEAILASVPLSYLGRISYGVYLYHFTIYYVVKRELRGDAVEQWLARLALEVGLTLAVAALSYHVVETWFLKKKDDDRWTSVASRSGATPTPS